PAQRVLRRGACRFRAPPVAAAPAPTACRSRPRHPLRRSGNSIAEEMSHRCVDAALAVGYARRSKPHFNSRQGAHQHQLIEPAEMADAEGLAGEPSGPGAESNVKAMKQGPT